MSVEQTDHMVEEGAAGLAAVGFAVGLFAPPLLAATAIGAAVGAVGGKALHKKTGSKIEAAAGETIPLGGAGLIVAYRHEAAAKVEPAVTRPIKRVVGDAEGHHVKALKGALADAEAEDGRRGRLADRSSFDVHRRRRRGRHDHRGTACPRARGREHGPAGEPRALVGGKPSDPTRSACSSSRT